MAPGLAWSRSFVARLLRSTRSLHFSSAAPYLGELFDPDLEDRISHPAEIIAHRCAPPLATLINGKPYFIPGSTDDLILYLSSVAACAAAILRALPGEPIQDYGPPSAAELARGFCGNRASMRRAWRTMEGMVQQRLHDEGGTVLMVDIAQCCASMNPARLHALLRRAEAEPSAIAQLERMHEAWHLAGCRGLPLTGVFPLQIKLYLAEVDRILQQEGIDFFRLQDDFRLFCRTRDEAWKAVTVLDHALSAVGLRINRSKTILLAQGQSPLWRLGHETLSRRMADGIGRPLLCELLPFAPIRPLALRLLKLRYGSQCWPVVA